MKKVFYIVMVIAIFGGLTGCNKKDKTVNETINGFDIKWDSDFKIKANKDAVREAIRNMVRVEGGIFMMGDSLNGALENEGPIHNVYVSDFYICKTEVTQKLWYALMGTKRGDDSYQDWDGAHGLGDDYPAYRISYSDATRFIERLNGVTGLWFNIPTEAQWEYAARGGKSTSYKLYSGSDDFNEVAWVNSNSARCSVVAAKAPNELGLYDMSGNVWEMCRDWYEDYPETTGGTYISNPEGVNYGEGYKVFRGGSWNNDPKYSRVTTRYKQSIHYQDYQTGFRIAIQ